MSGYRPDFEAALRLFAQASEAMRARGLAAPVLVGGGAVELFTQSDVVTGDFDIVTARQEEFEAELRALGFSKPEGVGHTPMGWVHAELGLGFEVVGPRCWTAWRIATASYRSSWKASAWRPSSPSRT